MKEHFGRTGLFSKLTAWIAQLAARTVAHGFETRRDGLGGLAVRVPFE